MQLAFLFEDIPSFVIQSKVEESQSRLIVYTSSFVISTIGINLNTVVEVYIYLT